MSIPMFFAADGSYGDASDIAIVDLATLADDHLSYAVEMVHDWQVPDFARWFVENDHVQDGAEYGCSICEAWEE